MREMLLLPELRSCVIPWSPIKKALPLSVSLPILGVTVVEKEPLGRREGGRVWGG